MFKKYLSATLHRAGQFTVGMPAADIEVLCLDINRGRDPRQSDVCIYNGSDLFIRKTSGQVLTVSPGNWIVRMPDESLDVHADADFCAHFCPAA
jgi:hypothetical protein